MPSRLLSAAALLLATCATPVLAEPEGLVVLREFLAEVQSFSARFEQQVIDGRGELVERSGGLVLMRRPGRFRWDYSEPYERTIVADGSAIWLYEPDLEQATTRALDSSGLRDTPAALLTGEQDVLDRFEFIGSWEQDALLWTELQPRQPEADFLAVRLAFAGRQLVRIDLADRLGQVTRVSFSEVQVNPPLADAQFIFTVPPGVDVIGDVHY